MSKTVVSIAPAVLDPFGLSGNRAARRHPRRDPEGHPNPNPAPNPNPEPKPEEVDWAKVFEGMTPAEVKEKLDHSRKWETRAKDNRDAAEKWKQIEKALPGEGGDTPPDPAKLATDLTAAQREARETKVENAILLLAPTKGADAGSLIDSRSFMAKIKGLDLDPASADFTEKLTAEIESAATSHPIAAIARGPLPNPQQGNPGHQKAESNISAGRARYKERNSK